MEDVILPRGRSGLIHVRAKTVNGEAWQPKTRRNRAVPVSSDLRHYLNRYAPPPSDSGWYFPSPHGHQWQHDQAQSRRLGHDCDCRATRGALNLQPGGASVEDPGVRLVAVLRGDD